MEEKKVVLAKSHSMNKCLIVSMPLLHKEQAGSRLILFLSKLCFEGKIFLAALQRKFLTLLCTWAFHMAFQSFWQGGLEGPGTLAYLACIDR